MGKKNKILVYIILMFVLIPPAGFLLCLYSEVWHSEIFFKVLDNPLMGVFTVLYIPFIIRFSNKKLNFIKANMDNTDPMISVAVQNVIARLPVQIIIACSIFCVVGCTSSMLFKSFISVQTFILAEVLAISLLLLMAVPFFLKMLYCLEEYTASVPISKGYTGLTYKVRMYIVTFFSMTGSLLLIAATSLSIVYHNQSSGGDLLSYLTLKLIPITAVSMLIMFVNILMVVRHFSFSLKKATTFASKISDQDLHGDELIVDSRDEIGLLATSLNVMQDHLRNIIKSINYESNSLLTSSDGLLELSRVVNDRAVQLSEKSTDYSVFAEEVSSNVDNVATAVEEANVNLSSISGSAEQMTATISEISSNIYTAKTSFSEVVELSANASKSMKKLDGLAGEIGQINDTINDISEQTKLLSLNATIEAARAGERGKGFSVVASEVKELASQSNISAKTINDLIRKVTDSIKTMLNDTQCIKKAIDQVNDVVVSISTSIEEQTVSIKDVSEHITQSSVGMSEVSKNVCEVKNIVHDVTRESVAVKDMCNEVKKGNEGIESNAGELSKVADRLRGLVSGFKT